MKHLISISFLCLLSFVASAQTKITQPVVAAYVTAGSKVVPNPEYLTHINYAFGHVDSTFAGLKIANEARLKDLVMLKTIKPTLKVVLSIGGWTSGRFSEMADNPKYRKSFIADCKAAVKEFKLDGIDLDWEYPSSSEAGISSSPRDIDNFTLLVKELRKALGKKHILSIATIARAEYIDFEAIEPYVDLVNIMAYDLDRPPYHHASLFRSEKTKQISCEEAVNAHINAGIPAEKLTLGMPFYGHAAKTVDLKGNSYRDLMKAPNLIHCWDDVAKVPYMTDNDGNMVCTYEDERSIEYKCQFIRKMHLAGAMYWEYSCDDDSGTLQRAVYDNIMSDSEI